VFAPPDSPAVATLQPKCVRLDGTSRGAMGADGTAETSPRRGMEALSCGRPRPLALRASASAADPVVHGHGVKLHELAFAPLIWEQAIEGNDKALGRVLAIVERRAKLLGLDAPAKRPAEVSPTGLRLKRETLVKQILSECRGEGALPAEGERDRPYETIQPQRPICGSMKEGEQ
jgi:hypothetical protein